MRKLLFILLAAAAAVGCTKDDNIGQIASSNVVNFSSESISTRTTTGDCGVDSWVANKDEIGIFSVGFSTDYQNVKYLAKSTGTSTDFYASGETIVFPNIEEGTVSFYAYYPYSSLDEDDYIEVDISGQKGDYNAVDFMIATGVDKEEDGCSSSFTYGVDLNDNTKVIFPFEHRLSKVIFKISLNDNLTSLNGLTASLKEISTQAPYIYKSNTFAEASTGTIELTVVEDEANGSDNVEGATVTAILFPDRYTSSTTLEFSVGERVFTVAFATTLDVGSSHTFTIALGNDITGFETGSTIGDWTPVEEDDLRPEEASYIEFTRYESSPQNITKVDTKGTIASILSQFRRGLAIAPDASTAEVNFCPLNNDDSNYYDDDTKATLTGSYGDVMVYFPEFWYKYENVDENTFRYYLSETEIVDGVHVEASLLGAFKSYMAKDNGVVKMYSAVGTAYSAYTKADYIGYAQAKGEGYQIIDYDHHCIIAMMSYAKYLTRDTPGMIGKGISVASSSSHTVGTTASLGNNDTKVGDAILSNGEGFATILGLEAPFSGGEEIVDGVSIDDACNWSITTPSGTRTVTAVAASGYIQSLALEGYSIGDSYPQTQYFDMVPSATYGTSDATQYYCDYTSYGASYSDYILVRGHTGGTGYLQAGPALALTNSSPLDDNSGAAYGRTSRLAFRGKINIISTDEYKAQFIE